MRQLKRNHHFPCLEWTCDHLLKYQQTVTGCDVVNYKEELILSLSSARELAVPSIRQGQQQNKKRYDQKIFVKELNMGDWVLVRFPQESGKQRKLSKPWHVSYQIIKKTKTGVIALPIHFPESGSIQVHSSRVTPCPPEWPVGFYWYGGNRLSRGKAPTWVDKLLEAGEGTLADVQADQREETTEEEVESNKEKEDTTEEEAKSNMEEETTEGEAGNDTRQKEALEEGTPPTGQYNLRQRAGFPLWLVDQLS